MNIDQKIIKIISLHLGIPKNEIQENSYLKEDLNAQNIEIADLLMKLEKEFSIRLSPQEAQNIETVRDIIDIFKIL